MVRSTRFKQPRVQSARPSQKVSKFPRAHAQRRSFAFALALFTLALVWTLLLPMARTLVGTGMGGLELAFWRLLFAGGVFALHARLSGRLELKPPRWGFLLASLGLALPYTAPLFLNGRTPLNGLYLAAFLVAVAALSLLWLRGDNTLRKLNLVLASGLALYALAVAGGVSAETLLRNGGWGVTVGVGLAAYALACRGLERRAPVTLYALALPLGALALLPLVAGHVAPKSAGVWLLLAVFALLSTYGLYALHALALRSLGASKTSVVTTAEPVAALLTVAPFLLPSAPWLGFLTAGFVLLMVAAFPPVLAAQRSAKRRFLRDRALGAVGSGE